MNNHSSLPEPRRLFSPFRTPRPALRIQGAFTLIELLVVIAVITILAAMIFPIAGAATAARIRSKARAELGEVQFAIENYKSKLGHYPPDNPGNPSLHQLYFELLGTTNAGTTASPLYVTLDGSARIPGSQLATVFGPGVAGFVNCTQAGGGDEGKFATPFLHDLKPGQVATYTGPQIKFLVCSVPTTGSTYLGGRDLTPIFYNSSSPTNSPNSYDLWIDVVVRGKTNRIANWSKRPLILP